MFVKKVACSIVPKSIFSGVRNSLLTILSFFKVRGCIHFRNFFMFSYDFSARICVLSRWWTRVWNAFVTNASKYKTKALIFQSSCVNKESKCSIFFQQAIPSGTNFENIPFFDGDASPITINFMSGHEHVASKYVSRKITDL